MFAGLGLLLLVVPIVELYVLIQVGQGIGVEWTILLLIGVSILGIVLLKREGVAAWGRLQEAIAAGRMPTNEVTDGALIILGGALLITPGFVTDIVGFLFLFPITRAGAKVFFRKALGVAIVHRYPGASTAATTGRRVYDARVSRERRVDEGRGDRVRPPGQLPSEPPGPSDEDGSRDTKA